MNDFLKNKNTIFFTLSIVALIFGIVVAIVLATGVSAPDKLAAMYLFFGLIPILLIIVIDRICVWKFGTRKVNKIQLYILICFIGLFVINWIRLQLQV
jgi:hypothetical protein